MTTVTILQPGYIPWLGFFEQLLRSDIFVYYDDVQFDKHGWRNRNRIKSPQGPQWLTVPVLHSKRHGQRNLDVEIDHHLPWARKHRETIRQNYAKSPHIHTYLPQLDEIFQHTWTKLLDLDVMMVELICQWLGIKRQVEYSSRLNIGGERNTRLLNICRHFSADCYRSGNSAKEYLDTNLFEEYNIKVEWQDFVHPEYPQQHGQFLPYLSILDLLFNVGQGSLAYLTTTNNSRES